MSVDRELAELRAQTHRYVVTGIHPVRGYAPGAEFTACLPPAQEAALIAGGAIRRKQLRRTPAKK